MYKEKTIFYSKGSVEDRFRFSKEMFYWFPMVRLT